MRNEPERLELGPDIVESDGPRRRLPKWWPLAAVAAVVLIVIVNQSRDTKSSSEPEPTPSPTISQPSATPSFTPSAEPTPSVAVEEVGHPLLGVTAGWELFGRNNSLIVRIEFAKGRLTHTTVTGLLSGGPVSFIAGPEFALVRPLDFVAGYMVPDGQPAQHVAQALNHGLAFPGPDPRHIWIQGENNRVALVDFEGRPTGTTIEVPMGSWATSDGAGYLLVNDTGGVYEARPEGLRRVTTGAVLAVGPTRLLTWECDDHHRCSAVVIDRATGNRRVVRGWEGDPQGMRGVISPNGALAALLLSDRSFGLLDLTTGVATRLPVNPVWNGTDGVAVWSPDSRWLFVAGDPLTVIDVETGQSVDLGVALPPLSQLAVRPAPF